MQISKKKMAKVDSVANNTKRKMHTLKICKIGKGVSIIPFEEKTLTIR